MTTSTYYPIYTHCGSASHGLAVTWTKSTDGLTLNIKAVANLFADQLTFSRTSSTAFYYANPTNYNAAA